MKNLVAIAVLFAAACGHKTDDAAPPPAPATAPGAPYDATHLLLGLDVKLSDGTQGPAAADHTRPVAARRLGAAELVPLFARMKPFALEPGDTKHVALRPASQPPPRPGETVATSFPPLPSSSPPAASETGELHVLRYMPEGAVPIAPQLSVTFSQPMVAVTSQSDAAGVEPVRLSPQPKGRWRWIGTRTIVFDPDPRFPQATTYRVEVPAGTRSATGAVLAHGVAFSFETPPPALVASGPDAGTPQPLDAPMFALFDQKIDPAAALASVRVTIAGRSAPVEVRQLTAAELAANADVKVRVAAAAADHQDGRWLAFRAAERLPTDAAVTVTFPSGLPSSEGPNQTKVPQSFSFHTYARFRLDRVECKTGCSPDAPLELALDNPIDTARFDEQLVTVTPAIPNLHVIASGTVIELVGDLLPRRRYEVEVARGLTDVFGQTLAKPIDETFAIGDAQPAFFGPSGMVVLDPAEPKPVLDFFTTNYDQLNVKLYRVEPGDYPAYEHYIENLWNHDHPPPPPGPLASSGLVHTKSGANRLLETAVDLAPALTGGRGDVVAIVEPWPWHQTYQPPRLVAWVQATRLGLDAHVDGDSVVAYASDLATGKPLANVAVRLEPGDARGTTDASGVVTLPATLGTSQLLIATAGDQHAFVVGNGGVWSGHAPQQLAWYVVDDRQLYRPGETVALKGWLRRLDPGKRGDVEPLDGSFSQVAYSVFDSRNNKLLDGTAKVGGLGGFDTTFTLSGTPNLGQTRVELTADGQTFEHYIQVEEFRRPEFEVSAHAGGGPYVVADAGADVTVDAKYYSGGPLAGADVHWVVSASQTSFTPPNRDDYIFGAWRAWWGGVATDDDTPDPSVKRLPSMWTHQSKTDAAGEHVLHLDFASVSPALPMAVTAEAAVTDVNRQQWSATTSLIVHPSADYVGLKPHKTFVEQGTPFDVDVIGVDVDGKPAIGAKIELRSVRLDWAFEHGRYRSKELDPQTCEVVAAQAAQGCHFATATGGTYRLVATIVDARHRPSRTELTYWVAGGATGAPRSTVTLIPDDKQYAVGDTANVLVASPFYPAEGIVTWRRSGIVKMQRITLTGPSTVLKVPITEDLVPNVYVHVDVIGQAMRTDAHGVPDPKQPRRPAYATGEVDLAIPPKTRTLGVTVTPAAAKVAPGAKTTLAVRVVDPSGRPVPNAEVAVLAVDESVLALASYSHPSPLAAFYAERGAGVEDVFSRAYLATAERMRYGRYGYGYGYGYRRFDISGGENFKTTTLEEVDGELDDRAAKDQVMDMVAEAPPPTVVAAVAPMSLTKTAETKNERDKSASNDPMSTPASTPIAVRSNFDPLATFAPSVVTGADGTATVALALPDNLTRYRLVAIAAAGAKQFGKGESSLTARLPLMVRPSAPRFLNYGDAFRLPIAVQNQTDRPMTVRVAVRAANAALTDGAGREVRVPANDRVLVEIPMAAELPGTARLQIVGQAGAVADAAELALPVWTPATTEAFATYGVLDGGAVGQSVALPHDVVPTFGGLEVSTSSTNLQALTDALLYLVHYPFDCAEQRASRIVSIAALRDELAAFDAEDLPTAATLAASMADDVAHLANMQNSDGGFAFWDRGHPSDPYLSVFVVNALARAKAKGLEVPPALFANAAPYLANVEAHIPSDYGREERASISAFALATRKLLGNVDVAKGQRLLRDMGGPGQLAMEADGWLLELFAGSPQAAAERAAISRYALNHVSETAGAANFTTGYGDGAHLLLASDRRVDAVMLEALIDAQPDSDLIPKLVTGLLAHRTAGRWDSTQENSFALVALDRYFRTYEKITPDFVARVWLGTDYAGDHTFAGRTTETSEIDVAMPDVAAHDHKALVIAKAGAGRLYYRVAMRYAPASLQLAPVDDGFAVERRYEAVDDPADVARAADGTWHVKAGARVRIRVSMVNDNRRYQVALVDPLPAGFEPMNPGLAATPSIPRDPAAARAGWWASSWYEHQNLRDDRAEAFASLLWEGVHEYTYVARATTPGNFVVPPPKAEEMYSPETFGRGASDRVIVE